MSGKVLGLVILSKILSTDQIAGFWKVQCLEKKYGVNFFICIDIHESNKSTALGLSWLGMPKVLQNDKSIVTPEWVLEVDILNNF